MHFCFYLQPDIIILHFLLPVLSSLISPNAFFFQTVKFYKPPNIFDEVMVFYKIRPLNTVQRTEQNRHNSSLLNYRVKRKQKTRSGSHACL